MKDNRFILFVLRASFWISLLAMIAGFALGQWAAESGDWILFLGRFHPVMLHMPIGVFTAFLLVLLVNCLTKNEGTRFACDLMLALTAVSASLAAAAGFLLASEGGFDPCLLYTSPSPRDA